MKNKRNKDIDKDSMCPNCAHYNSWISNGKNHCTRCLHEWDKNANKK